MASRRPAPGGVASRGVGSAGALAMQMKKKEAQGDAKYKEAEKLASRTVRRWRPDWEGASRAYSDAALLFKTCKAYGKAKVAYVKAGHAHHMIGSLFISAQAYETGAMMAKELGQLGEMAEHFETAIVYYRENQNSDRAAEALVKCGRLLSEADPEKAVAMLLEAIDVYEIEDKEIMAGDAYKIALSVLVKVNRIDQAIRLIHKYIGWNEKKQNWARLYQSYLQIVVLLLYSGDFKEADQSFQDFLHVSGFFRSEQGKLCNALIEACENRDEEAMVRLRQSPTLGFLDPQVARIARKLQIPDVVEAIGRSELTGGALGGGESGKGAAGGAQTRKIGGTTAFVFKPTVAALSTGSGANSVDGEGLPSPSAVFPAEETPLVEIPASPEHAASAEPGAEDSPAIAEQQGAALMVPAVSQPDRAGAAIAADSTERKEGVEVPEAKPAPVVDERLEVSEPLVVVPETRGRPQAASTGPPPPVPAHIVPDTAEPLLEDEDDVL